VVTADRWIIDGNYHSTMEIRLAAADTIVLLDTPTIHRLIRVLTRRLARSGPTRPDLIGAERLNWPTLRYVATFNRTHRPRMLKTITAHGTHATLEILRTTADIHALLGRAHPPKGEEFLRSQPGKSDDR
jgi:adenylate kinase family enzyme